MPQYMLLIYGDPSLAPANDSPEGQAEFGRWMAYTQAMRDAGVFVAGDALHGAETASTVGNASEKITARALNRPKVPLVRCKKLMCVFPKSPAGETPCRWAQVVEM